MVSDLMQQGLISETDDTQNISYLLNDNNLFFLTGYKVLHNQEKKGLIKCVKLKYNGKLKILYLSSNYKTLISLLPSLNANSFINVLVNLLSSILDIKSNGFLKCQNIDISLDKIFVDTSTYSVHLIYLPITSNVGNQNSEAFESELRTILIKLINSTPNIASEGVLKISAALANATNSLEQLYKIVKSESAGGGLPPKLSKQPGGGMLKNQPQMRLSSINSSDNISFNINKPDFVIGKNAAAVDGAISFNKAISRVHCKIIYNGRYLVIDLGSANGTYINNIRLLVNNPAAINNGDTLKLANCEFYVSI